MKVNNQSYETIWLKPGDPRVIQIIDQRFLPFRFVIEDISSTEEMFHAIRDMHLRGAPLIGAAGAFGMYLAAINLTEIKSSEYYINAANYLKSSRPTSCKP